MAAQEPGPRMMGWSPRCYMNVSHWASGGEQPRRTASTTRREPGMKANTNRIVCGVCAKRENMSGQLGAAHATLKLTRIGMVAAKITANALVCISCMAYPQSHSNAGILAPYLMRTKKHTCRPCDCFIVRIASSLFNSHSYSIRIQLLLIFNSLLARMRVHLQAWPACCCSCRPRRRHQPTPMGSAKPSHQRRRAAALRRWPQPGAKLKPTAHSQCLKAKLNTGNVAISVFLTAHARREFASPRGFPWGCPGGPCGGRRL